MRITLQIDYNGNPQLRLISDKRVTNLEAIDELLELFIRRAKAEGIEIVNVPSDTTRDDYALIKIKGVNK